MISCTFYTLFSGKLQDYADPRAAAYEKSFILLQHFRAFELLY